MSRDASIHPVGRALMGACLAGMAGLLGWVVVDLPASSAGLGPAVGERLADTGTTNPVTAVLLNLRAYDTLLELVVLTLTVVAVWSIRLPHQRLAGQPGHVLTAVVSLLTPLMVLVGGYLLWAGAAQPGGAFQAGAVIASAAVLLLLANLPAVRAPAWAMRLVAALAVLAFVAVGLVGLVDGGTFLDYPTGWDAAAIVVLEVVATVSIALVLAGVFAQSPRVLTHGYDDSQEEAP